MGLKGVELHPTQNADFNWRAEIINVNWNKVLWLHTQKQQDTKNSTECPCHLYYCGHLEVRGLVNSVRGLDMEVRDGFRVWEDTSGDHESCIQK